jgi:hypothetical protein
LVYGILLSVEPYLLEAEEGEEYFSLEKKILEWVRKEEEVVGVEERLEAEAEVVAGSRVEEGVVEAKKKEVAEVKFR